MLKALMTNGSRWASSSSFVRFVSVDGRRMGSRTRAKATTRTMGCRIMPLCVGCCCLASPGKSAGAADLAGAVHDVVDRFEPGAWFCAMRFWTTVGEAGSKVCRAASRARAFGKLFPDFQLFPLISTWFRSFDNKNNFLSGAALQALWRSGPDSMEPSRLISRNLA